VDRDTLREMGRRYPVLGPMLDITFKKGGINALKLLWNSGGDGSVIFENDMLILAIVTSGSWDHDSNRIVRAYFPLGLMWKKSIFMEEISKEIESIRLSSKHPLNTLMTGRKKIQEEVAAEIIRGCCGEQLFEEFGEFQFLLSGKFEIFCGLPQVAFQVEAMGESATIILDGWGSQMIVDRVPQQKAYGGPDEFHDAVRKLVYGFLDKVTAPAK
jgi:hypothetical protein